jgi:hypothetical protein
MHLSISISGNMERVSISIIKRACAPHISFGSFGLNQRCQSTSFTFHISIYTSHDIKQEMDWYGDDGYYEYDGSRRSKRLKYLQQLDVEQDIEFEEDVVLDEWDDRRFISLDSL